MKAMLQLNVVFTDVTAMKIQSSKYRLAFGELLGKVHAHYVYIMKDNVWYVSLGGGPLQVLSEVLSTAEVKVNEGTNYTNFGFVHYRLAAPLVVQ